MPVFFFVGGFANGTAWDAARRNRLTYGVWLDSRLRRLLGPVLPLLFQSLVEPGVPPVRIATSGWSEYMSVERAEIE